MRDKGLGAVAVGTSYYLSFKKISQRNIRHEVFLCINCRRRLGSLPPVPVLQAVNAGRAALFKLIDKDGTLQEVKWRAACLLFAKDKHERRNE